MKNYLNYRFSHVLYNWYQKNKRDLPWRDTTDPYEIWLSEIILQQTRVQQGIPYYLNFLKNFPTIKELALADENRVLRLWQGLGYYTRARNLLKCAQTIVSDNEEKFPNDVAELIKLPGIGPYTASAIASFAFRQPIVAVDGNALRVFTRLFGITGDIRKGKVIKQITTIAQQNIDLKHPDIFNHAIMDLGSTVCLPANPVCNQCPFMGICIAFKEDLQMKLPFKSKQAKPRHRYFNYQVVVHNQSIGMQRRNGGDIWEGLYEFPLVENSKLFRFDEMDFPIIEEMRQLPGGMDIAGDYKHILSHQVIHARFFITRMQKIKSDRISPGIHFYSFEEIVTLPKPTLINNFFEEYFNSN